MVATLDLVMERTEALPIVVEPVPTHVPKIEPQAGQPKPGPDHRRGLHEWISGLDLDTIGHEDLVLLVREMVETLAGTRPPEGMTFDPYEQIRMALEAAADKDRDGRLDGPIGVYARGVINKRIIGDVFTPLADSKAKAKAEAAAQSAAAHEAAISERKRLKDEAVAQAHAKTEADKARWAETPQAVREPIEAKVKAKHPELVRWENMLLPHYIEALDERQRE